MKKNHFKEAGKLGGQKTAEISKQRKAKRIEEYNLNPKRCPVCDTPIPYKSKYRQTYCSQSCAAKIRNKGVRRHGNAPLQNKCHLCSKKTSNEKFCSVECCNQNFRVEAWKRIENSTWDGNKLGASKVLRQYLLHHRGHKCEGCKLSEWQGKKIPLTVHHVDGDAHNNSLENVVLYCWNCHALTDNFGRKNKLSTRSYRYE